MKLTKCGDANQNGSVSLFYKGGCKQEVDIEKTYRCVGCGGRFHKDCIIKHFELEKEHDYGKNKLAKEILQILTTYKCGQHLKLKKYLENYETTQTAQ